VLTPTEKIPITGAPRHRHLAGTGECQQDAGGADVALDWGGAVLPNGPAAIDNQVDSRDEG
jgi:hypothetical protein